MAFGSVTFPRSTRTPRSRDGGAWAVAAPKMATRCCSLADLQNRSLWRHTGIWSTQSPSPTVASLRSDHACTLHAMYRYRKSWIYGWPYTAPGQTYPSTSCSRRLMIVPPTRHVRRSPRPPTKWAITGSLHPFEPLHHRLAASLYPQPATNGLCVFSQPATRGERAATTALDEAARRP